MKESWVFKAKTTENEIRPNKLIFNRAHRPN
jgi:hypothetical protein